MSSGRTHHAATVIIAIASTTGLYYSGTTALMPALAVGAGCLAGTLITPDLDVETGVHANGVANRVHWFFGMAWRIIWIPYAYVVRHRSPLSHWPLIGTALRILYLGAVGWFVWRFMLSHWFGLPAFQWWMPYAFAGLCLADFGHWLLDLV